MHSIQDLRQNPEVMRNMMRRRGLPDTVSQLLAMDMDKRATEAALQACEARRNELSRLIPTAAKSNPEALPALKEEASGIKAMMPALVAKASDTAAVLRDALMHLPNILRDDVPDGADETCNVVVESAKEPETLAHHIPHWEFAPRFGMDFDAGIMLGGSRFTVLRGNMARLSRVLGQFMLDTVIEAQQAEEINAPFIVLPEVMAGTGQLPKFADDLFRIDNDGSFLIPTGEVTLTNLVREQAIDLTNGPLRMATLSHCFRREVGGAGRDVRGYIRQHQFEKVEMVTVCEPEYANNEQMRMLGTARKILDMLGLKHRTILLCAGDTGFSAARTYDIEVWMPGTRTWREISSISTCGDFQARRMKTRLKSGGIPHTLNGSGLAVGRTLVAVLENGLMPDDTVWLPEPLAERMKMQYIPCL